MTKEGEQQHEVFGDPMLGMAMLILFLMQLLHYVNIRDVCSCD